MKLAKLMITTFLITATVAMINLGYDSSGNTVVASSNCEETPNGDVEHCTFHDEGEQGGGPVR